VGYRNFFFVMLCLNYEGQRHIMKITPGYFGRACSISHIYMHTSLRGGLHQLAFRMVSSKRQVFTIANNFIVILPTTNYIIIQSPPLPLLITFLNLSSCQKHHLYSFSMVDILSFLSSYAISPNTRDCLVI
jgi:hypothetical protein